MTQPQAQAQFQPIILQNPKPFVLQPPPPGRKARLLGAPLQQAMPTGLPAAVPLQPLAGPQRPPDVRPKVRSQVVKRDASLAAKTSTDIKPKEKTRQERIVGEIAFQLDRRILANIFPNQTRLYGFTVSNITEKVAQGRTDPFLRMSSDETAAAMNRYRSIMDHLRPLGFDPNMHPIMMEHIVNTYGILRERPNLSDPEAANLNDVQYLQNVIKETVSPEMQETCQLLLNCLYQLSLGDGKSLFLW
ncbi:speriolin [Sceloporus undulatus]|uniref:speriolin n=1 Tax=Sceloporus undulatus TaxID=8520 RepID=UPI001C4BC15A|nr:speriolin [Sceloporus undulatus]